jgi:hypothetical protein
VTARRHLLRALASAIAGALSVAVTLWAFHLDDWTSGSVMAAFAAMNAAHSAVSASEWHRARALARRARA